MRRTIVCAAALVALGAGAARAQAVPCDPFNPVCAAPPAQSDNGAPAGSGSGFQSDTSGIGDGT